jgi:endogenous inhibitor of DNA gyrase (YacG/DUF329 family)
MSSDKPSPSSQPSLLTCSTCGRRFYLDETDSPPFCSERCKLIDLGRWLDESIQIPHEGGPERGDHGDQDESE